MKQAMYNAEIYENFHIFHFQKRIVSAETIRGNMVTVKQKSNFIIVSIKTISFKTNYS